MLEHPEISWIERTGYPSWMQEEDNEEGDEDRYYEELMKRVATSKVKTDVVSRVADTDGSYGGTPTGQDKKSWNTNW